MPLSSVPRTTRLLGPYKFASCFRVTCTLLALFRKSLIINGAGEGNRTLVSGLGSPHSTIEPHPLLDVSVFIPDNHSTCNSQCNFKREFGCLLDRCIWLSISLHNLLHYEYFIRIADLRRDFSRSSPWLAAALAAPGYFTSAPVRSRKIGHPPSRLVGCGGRGSGAADQALSADTNVVLTAMGDAFEDQLQSSLKELQRSIPRRSKSLLINPLSAWMRTRRLSIAAWTWSCWRPRQGFAHSISKRRSTPANMCSAKSRWQRTRREFAQ